MNANARQHSRRNACCDALSSPTTPCARWRTSPIIRLTTAPHSSTALLTVADVVVVPVDVAVAVAAEKMQETTLAMTDTAACTVTQSLVAARREAMDAKTPSVTNTGALAGSADNSANAAVASRCSERMPDAAMRTSGATSPAARWEGLLASPSSSTRGGGQKLTGRGEALRHVARTLRGRR